MRRYWVAFDTELDLPTGTRLGVGVTAASERLALETVREQLFGGGGLPDVVSVVEDVDIAQLDAHHVRPNMGDPTRPGIWYPIGRQQAG